MTTLAGTNHGTTTAGNPINSIVGAAVNNAILDPFQGHHADAYFIDQATGAYTLVGRFTSVQMTIRNATEPYLEFNQRVPRYLDGEIQIGWTAERGVIDTRILLQTQGYSAIGRELRINNSPRFQLVFEINAPDLDIASDNYSGDNWGTIVNGELAATGANKMKFSNDVDFTKRKAKGGLVLTFCKLDSLTIAATSGRSVIAQRMEGLAEGIEQIAENNNSISWAGINLASVANATDALKTFKDLYSNNGDSSGAYGLAGRPASIPDYQLPIEVSSTQLR